MAKLPTPGSVNSWEPAIVTTPGSEAATAMDWPDIAAFALAAIGNSFVSSGPVNHLSRRRRLAGSRSEQGRETRRGPPAHRPGGPSATSKLHVQLAARQELIDAADRSGRPRPSGGHVASWHD